MSSPGARQRVGRVVRRRFDARSGTPHALSRVRRRWLLLRARWHAWRVRSRVELRIADDVVVARGVRIEVGPGTTNRVEMGPGGRLGAGTFLELKGADIRFGPQVEVRHGTRFNVAGTLEVEGPSIFGEYCTVHCRNDVRIGTLTSFSERVVITDSSHHHEDPDAWFYHSVKPGSVRIGRNSWVAAAATVTRNVDIGDWCIVGANSVVVADVPDGHLASGVPATCTSLDYAWARRAEGESSA